MSFRTVSDRADTLPTRFWAKMQLLVISPIIAHAKNGVYFRFRLSRQFAQTIYIAIPHACTEVPNSAVSAHLPSVSPSGNRVARGSESCWEQVELAAWRLWQGGADEGGEARASAKKYRLYNVFWQFPLLSPTLKTAHITISGWPSNFPDRYIAKWDVSAEVPYSAVSSPLAGGRPTHLGRPEGPRGGHEPRKVVHSILECCRDGGGQGGAAVGGEGRASAKRERAGKFYCGTLLLAGKRFSITIVG